MCLFGRDSRHLVRMSVRELQESQKMLCRFNLCEVSTQSRGQSTVDGSAALMVDTSATSNTNEEKLDFLSAKVEVFEVIRPIQGSEYRMRCLHQV